MAIPTLAARQKAMQQAPEQARQSTAAAGPKRRLRIGYVDFPLLAILLLIMLFGLVMLFSASYPSGYLRRGNSYAFINSQVRYVVIGVVGMLAAMMIDYRVLKKFAWPVMLVTLALLLIVLFMPAKNNAQRWIWIDFETENGFQPSEIAKFALILVFAKMISANQSRIRSFQYGFFPFMALLGIVSVLLIMEPHLSCTILVIGIGLSMMFAGGTSVRWFMLAGGLVIGAVFLAITQFPNLIPDYAFERIAMWRDPLNSEIGDSHQIVQSLIAVGSGGITGKGIGQSVQKYLYLPEVYNDYIFAIVCEELGLVGALAVIALFLLLFARCIVIAMRAKDKFGSMLVIGIAVQIALQAFLHIAVNINAIPSTGISMPFFSYGGTSLCMLLGQVGVILSVSRQGGGAKRKAAAPPQTQDLLEDIPNQVQEVG